MKSDRIIYLSGMLTANPDQKFNAYEVGLAAKSGDLCSSTETDNQLWERLFSIENIKRVFWERIRHRSGPGVDRITAERFEKNLNIQSQIIRRKCLTGTYRFTPYLEELVLKSRTTAPRVLSIPAIRDKLVLSIMKDFMHVVFHEYISRDLPNTVIYRIKRELKKNPNPKFIRIDIKGFYENIQHGQLLNKVSRDNKVPEFARLLKRALENPTLPANYARDSRKHKRDKSVPQGLPISNILAELYIRDFDEAIRKESALYFRFVDDILIFCGKGACRRIWRAVSSSLSAAVLELNKEKSTIKWRSVSVKDGFTFLGYSFTLNGVSVRGSSHLRFLNAILGRITKYKASIAKIRGEDAAQKKDYFIWELNERITGAIDGRRRYGWIFFFLEITDLGLLHQIDRVISKALSRVPEFSASDRKRVKKVLRAYFEAKHSPEGGYINNYNKYATIFDKRRFLIFIGSLPDDPDAAYTDEQIDMWFQQAKTARLLKLERDVSMLS